MRKLITYDPNRRADRQILTPCSDCPWRRDALPGWLGSMTPDQWMQAAHGEAEIECHVFANVQCAGAAIYRANVAKRCRTSDVLRLSADREAVFATPSEFLAHHRRAP